MRIFTYIYSLPELFFLGLFEQLTIIKKELSTYLFPIYAQKRYMGHYMHKKIDKSAIFHVETYGV